VITPIPILILAGSDQRAGPIPPGLSAGDMLSGYKGALPLPWGGCLAAEFISRLRQTQRFADPFLIGPKSVYAGLVDCEVVDVAGSLAATLSRVVRLLQERFAADRPVAITTCDILPTPEELSDLLQTGYEPHADCQFWWQIVAAEPDQLGASAWKPRYALRVEASDPPQTVYPGHLVILRPEAVRFELINHLLVAAYRYRNWPLRDRFLPILLRGLGLLIQQDVWNLGRLQLPTLTASMPWHLLRAYRGVRTATLTLPDFEWHLARTVLHRRYCNASRPFVITPTHHLAFAKDIDTRAELEELAAT
jgi:hypothetical protein